MTVYDAVLFDSDGVLVEPPAPARQRDATKAAFRAVGIGDPEPTHVRDIVGGTTVDGLRDICAAYDLDPETFWEVRQRHDEQSQIEAFRANARNRYDDVEAIAELPPNRGIVSNNHHSTIAFKLAFFDLHPLFDTFYGRQMTVEGLERKKPNTHYIERALTDLSAETALYVGDRESDVRAAHRAGLDSAFLRRPHSRDVELSVTPTFEIDSLSDVAPLVE